MALSHTDTDIQKVKINKFSTLADFTAAQTGGLIGPDEISFVDEPINADWNQSDSTKADYIKNKPTIPDVTGKADKVSSPTSGDLAGLDANGNLTDSGITATSVSTAVTNSHTHSNKTVLDYVPSSLGTAGQALCVNSGGTGLEFATVQGGGGLSDYDFTHISNTTVSTSSTTITFAANTRGSQMITVSDDVSISFIVNNDSDNYLWIENSDTTNNIDVTISSVTHNGNVVSNVRMPRDGIAVPAGGTCEIGIVCNTDGAFITSRDDLE